MATIKDVARCAGVSTATVSKVVNGCDQHIGDTTRRKVNQAVKECGYVSNMLAKGLRTRRTNNIGVILPDIRNPFYAELAKGIQEAAQNRGFGILICNTDLDRNIEAQCLRLLKAQMVDGIVFGTRCTVNLDKEEALNLKLPVVGIGRFNEEMFHRREGRVFIDENRMTFDSTMKLAATGCKRIALVTANETGSMESNPRCKGFVEAMRALGREVSQDLIFFGEYEFDTGKEAVLNLIGKRTEFDGIVCGNDLIAIGALDMLRTLNISVPSQVKVIGLDNISFSAYTNPRLSTMSQPAMQMGIAASNMLIDNVTAATPMRNIAFDHIYIERETV